MSGQPRNFGDGFEELKKAYLDRYDCDVFMHTWKGKIHTPTNFFPQRPGRKYELKTDWEEDLQSLYSTAAKSVKFVSEEPKLFDEHNIIDPIWRQPLQNCKSMWYSVKQAYDLTNDSYDVYIRTRFDLRYESSTLELENLDLTNIHVWDWDVEPHIKQRGLYDVFAIGSYETMGIYSSLFTKIEWYLQGDEEYKESFKGKEYPRIMGHYVKAGLLPGWPDNQDSGLRNEYLLRWHLQRSGVPITIHNNTIRNADGHIIR